MIMIQGQMACDLPQNDPHSVGLGTLSAIFFSPPASLLDLKTVT